MSADNGVYVLVSRGRKTQHGYKKEYRVIHAQAVENIFESPVTSDGDSELNNEMVLEYFGEARVFTDRRVAEGYALATYDEWMRDFGVVEYGIRWFDEFAHVPFPQGKSVRQERPRRRRHTAPLKAS